MSECIVYREISRSNCIPEALITLYISAFPVDERRDWHNNSDIQYFLENHPDMHIISVSSENKFVGFISYWILNSPIQYIIYIEHLAVSKSLRGNGFGKRLINYIRKQYPKSGLILEVEPPTDDTSKRRIEFYEHLGLILHSGFEYIQPPYSSNKQSMHLNIMTTPDISQKQLKEFIIPVLHKKVYEVNL